MNPASSCHLSDGTVCQASNPFPETLWDSLGGKWGMMRLKSLQYICFARCAECSILSSIGLNRASCNSLVCLRIMGSLRLESTCKIQPQLQSIPLCLLTLSLSTTSPCSPQNRECFCKASDSHMVLGKSPVIFLALNEPGAFVRQCEGNSPAAI